MITSDVGSSICSGVADRSFELRVNSNMVNMGLINKVDMVCLSPVGYGV